MKKENIYQSLRVWGSAIGLVAIAVMARFDGAGAQASDLCKSDLSCSYIHNFIFEGLAMGKPAGIVVDGSPLVGDPDSCSVSDGDRLKAMASMDSKSILFPVGDDGLIAFCGKMMTVDEFVAQLDALPGVPTGVPTEAAKQVEPILPVLTVDPLNCPNLATDPRVVRTQITGADRETGHGTFELDLKPGVSINVTKFVNAATTLGYPFGENETANDYVPALTPWSIAQNNESGEVFTKPESKLSVSMANFKIVLIGSGENKVIMSSCDFARALESSIDFVSLEQEKVWQDFEHPPWMDPEVYLPYLLWGAATLVGSAASIFATMWVMGVKRETEWLDIENAFRRNNSDRLGMEPRDGRRRVLMPKGYEVVSGDRETTALEVPTKVLLTPLEFDELKEQGLLSYYPSLFDGKGGWVHREAKGRDGAVVMPKIETDIGLALSVLPSDQVHHLTIKMFGNPLQNKYLTAAVQAESEIEDGINKIVRTKERLNVVQRRMMEREAKAVDLLSRNKRIPMIDQALHRQDQNIVEACEGVIETTYSRLVPVQLDLDALTELYKQRCVEHKFGPENEVHIQGSNTVFYFTQDGKLHEKKKK